MSLEILVTVIKGKLEIAKIASFIQKYVYLQTALITKNRIFL